MNPRREEFPFYWKSQSGRQIEADRPGQTQEVNVGGLFAIETRTQNIGSSIQRLSQINSTTQQQLQTVLLEDTGGRVYRLQERDGVWTAARNDNPTELIPIDVDSATAFVVGGSFSFTSHGQNYATANIEAVTIVDSARNAQQQPVSSIEQRFSQERDQSSHVFPALAGSIRRMNLLEEIAHQGSAQSERALREMITSYLLKVRQILSDSRVIQVLKADWQDENHYLINLPIKFDRIKLLGGDYDVAGESTTRHDYITRLGIELTTIQTIIVNEFRPNPHILIVDGQLGIALSANIFEPTIHTSSTEGERDEVYLGGPPVPTQGRERAESIMKNLGRYQEVILHDFLRNPKINERGIIEVFDRYGSPDRDGLSHIWFHPFTVDDFMRDLSLFPQVVTAVDAIIEQATKAADPSRAFMIDLFQTRLAQARQDAAAGRIGLIEIQQIAQDAAVNAVATNPTLQSIASTRGATREQVQEIVAAVVEERLAALQANVNRIDINTANLQREIEQIAGNNMQDQQALRDAVKGFRDPERVLRAALHIAGGFIPGVQGIIAIIEATNDLFGPTE